MGNRESTATRIDALRERISRDAPEITRRIRKAADDNPGSEARFRTLFAQIIEPWAQALDIPILVREERTLAAGRADATYNRMVIEYEAPGRLRDNVNHGATAHAIQQAKDYVEGVAHQERQHIHRLIGVVIDGCYFIYVRIVEGHWTEPEVESVNEQSVARFLRLLVSLTSGKALLPDNLVQDFGSNTIYAQRIASSLYQSLSRTLDDGRTDIVDKLFEQWKTFFGEVTGYEEGSHPLRNRPELRQFARGMGVDVRTVDPPRLFFTVHTYFALLIKLIAYYALSRFVSGFGTRFGSMYQLDDEDLKREMEDLERGGIFRTLGIRNFLEGDFFKWYLDIWDANVAQAIRTLLDRLKDYDPGTLEVSPEQARDLLKKLYHRLMPREIRHDLGEYYTPDWLAEHVLNELGYEGQTTKRLLDPACGSGTFLVLAIKRLKERCFRDGLNEQETLETILNNIVGIDLNPLAVVAARTNYLLALGDLLVHRTHEIDIPVYLADSVLTPSAGEELFNHDRYELETVVGMLHIPSALQASEQIDKLCNLLEECVRSEVVADAFLIRAKKLLEIDDATWIGGDGRGEGAASILRGLYCHLSSLHRDGLDGIWARILQNAFMPLFVGHFDYVAGNPPWVFWNNLPESHREKVRRLMATRYGLTALSASSMKRLGQAGKDLSALFVYVAFDHYLAGGGRLGFVITQTLFQSTASNEFRSFRIPGKASFAVVRVDDLVRVSPFKTATNKTACMFAAARSATTYPVSYYVWTPKGRFDRDDASLSEAMAACNIDVMHARPSSEPTTFWVIREQGADGVAAALNPERYRPRLGVETKLEAVFRVKPLSVLPSGELLVQNVLDRAKKPVPQVSVRLELDLLHPFVSGASISRWRAETAGVYLLTHSEATGMKPLSQHTMQTNYPLSYAYLKHFQKQLEDRSLHKRWGANNVFYAMYDIGPYTFAPWKVAWKRTTRNFEACVLGSLPIPECNTERMAIPNGKVMIIPFQDEEEAHFVCALLNSAVARSEINASISSEAHRDIINVVSIPTFSMQCASHRRLASLSKDAHAKAKSRSDLKTVELEVDKAVAELWGIDDVALAQYRGRVGSERISDEADDETDSEQPPTEAHMVLEALDGNSEATVAAIAATTKIAASDLRPLLRQLIDAGQIEQLGRGRGTRYKLVEGGET